MDADEFISRATDPGEWYTQSQALRVSANVLWDKAESVLLERQMESDIEKGESVSGEEYFGEEYIHLSSTAQMLNGLALETALKGRILEKQPEDVTLEVEIDGKNEPQDVSLKELGVDIGKGHKINKLAEIVGLFGKDIYSDNKKLDRLKHLLSFLSQVVRWGGRYPIPNKLRERRQWEDSIKDAKLIDIIFRPTELLDPVFEYLLEGKV